jgi:hypothetical protein
MNILSISVVFISLRLFGATATLVYNIIIKQDGAQKVKCPPPQGVPASGRNISGTHCLPDFPNN